MNTSSTRCRLCTPLMSRPLLRSVLICSIASKNPQRKQERWRAANQPKSAAPKCLKASTNDTNITPPLWVLYWLSGLTCNNENFIIKSGAQRVASTEGIALIVPDTSPRGLNVEGEADSYDFGVGARFYLNATIEKWKNWQMYDYIVKELPKVLSDNFPQLDTSRESISGHSMGGHGALTICLKKLDKYKSVSAFAPIVNPINCPWGQKAFTNYLGDDKTAWEEYDATCLIKKFNDVGATIMIDQGDDDKFLHENQLLPSKFDEACGNVKAPLLLRMQHGGGDGNTNSWAAPAPGNDFRSGYSGGSCGGILMAAGDTFRAAPSDQLGIWAERTGCEIVLAEKEKAKASSGR
ncbi:hypothetical protein L2E82_42963 [Cichorium intybus]|uniref:Uncharacterized protein n=1 Tax=Cichorium intybus TaxID=13427 RepID=A0ACB8ZMY0_CICIN|nr:hypothetical protein L2E82_42963 [Cichorium intybus]